MINLIGTYECKSDVKGRLMLPSAIKKQLQSVLQEGFVLKRSVFQKCLELYPMSEWNEMMKDVNKLNRFVKKNNDFVRLFTAGVKMVDLDAAGRMLISKDLHSFSGITKEVVVHASGSYVEIWDKDRYEQAINNAVNDFPSLAEEVMGNTAPDELS
ncbi:MAG: division/cell wall cluster transcriptional repressor MraZ [Flavobacteriaceae bacterium]